MKVYKYFLLTLLVVVIDQISKLLVHKYMLLGETVSVLGYGPYDPYLDAPEFGFKIHYLLNAGMAFGLKWQNEFGKLALTVFRIGAMFGIGYYLITMAKKAAHPGFLWCMALILAGALGNVIDSTFYGVFIEGNVVSGAPTPWFHGQVIDMLFFPLFKFNWPLWIPKIGGESFLFFSPVFNIADSSIFIGVVIILIMQKKFFKEKHETVGPQNPKENTLSDPSVPVPAEGGAESHSGTSGTP